MTSADVGRTRWQLGDLCVDAGARRLTRAGHEIGLPRLSWDMMLALLRAAPNAVTVERLMDEVWPGLVVNPETVSKRVNLLRQALDDDCHDPRYIEGIRGYGYRVVAPVTALDADEVAQTGSAPDLPDRQLDGQFPRPLEDMRAVAQRPRRGMHWAAGGIAALVALLLFGASRMSGDSPVTAVGTESSSAPMIAVLPFVSVGLSGDSEFFAHGIHDDLLTQLAQLESMRVISRTSVSEYRGSDMNIREIGRQLGADAILQGGVERLADQIRINVQLIDAGTDVHLWAERYDRELTLANIFQIQGEIARAIAGALNSTLTVHDATRLDVIPTESEAAYRAYHEAMEIRMRGHVVMPDYIEALERAVALDPGFIRASAELAGALSYVNIARHDPESIRRLEGMLDQIRAIAPRSSEYLIAQSYYTYYILKQHDRALELIRHAQTLSPSDPQILELQSWIQRRRGDINGMIESIRQARILDPRNPIWTYKLVTRLATAHRYDEAIDELENASVDSFRLAVMASILGARDHGEPDRLLDDLLALQEEYGEEADAFNRWEAYIASRDYDGAAVLLKAVQSVERPPGFWPELNSVGHELGRVITDWLLAGNAGAVPAVAAARAKLEQVDMIDIHRYVVMAYLTAAEGNTPETERLVRTWFRIAPGDLAEMVAHRHHVCRALGMAAAVTAAIECLESALVEPSRIAPFIEPFLPYYDPIRNDPAYVRFAGAARPRPE